MEVVQVRRWALVALLLVSACSGGGGGPPLPSAGPTPAGGTSAVPTPTARPSGPFDEQYATDPRSPVTWLVKPTGRARYDAALAAYRHWIFVVQRLGAAPDPADPELAAIASGAARDFFVKRFSETQRTHTNQLGGAVVRSANVRPAGPDVAVAACQDLTQAFVYVNGEKSPQAVGFFREVALLREVAGQWTVVQANGDQGTHC
jgi:hypothetical protein